MVHNSEPSKFGFIVKSARENSKMTVEELAEKLSLTDRYIYKIESGEKLPSFKVLYQLVRTLSINPNSIFYPEAPSKELEIEDLIRMLQGCDEEFIDVVKATVKALVDVSERNKTAAHN